MIRKSQSKTITTNVSQHLYHHPHQQHIFGCNTHSRRNGGGESILFADLLCLTDQKPYWPQAGQKYASTVLVSAVEHTNTTQQNVIFFPLSPSHCFIFRIHCCPGCPRLAKVKLTVFSTLSAFKKLSDRWEGAGPSEPDLTTHWSVAWWCHRLWWPQTGRARHSHPVRMRSRL